MSRRVTHRITIAKRTLYGARRWWATCTCKKFYQGCHEKQDAQEMAAEHIRKTNTKGVA